MEIIVAKQSGFCNGVNYSVNSARKLLKNNKEIYSLGLLVHNEQVIKELTNNGLIVVNDIKDIPNYSKVIFRAHGESLENYEIAKSKKLEIFDLTCGKVKIIRNKILTEPPSTFIIIIGKPNHPEVTANYSYCKDRAYIVDDIKDISLAYNKYKKFKYDKVYIISQTTYSSASFNHLVKDIKKTFKNTKIIIDNTICLTTKNRQDEVEKLAKEVDKMIIVGGKNSSNTKELYNIASEYTTSYLIQDITDLGNIIFKDSDRVGITTGASTPKDIMYEIIDKIKKDYISRI